MTLYVAGHGTMHTVLIKGGVLVSGVVLCALYVAGAMHSVLIKGGVLVSGVVLCVLYVAGAMHSVLIKGGTCSHFRGSFFFLNFFMGPRMT